MLYVGVDDGEGEGGEYETADARLLVKLRFSPHRGLPSGGPTLGGLGLAVAGDICLLFHCSWLGEGGICGKCGGLPGHCGEGGGGI